MNIQKLNTYWREGRYVDLWSINHVLSGIVLASLLFGLKAPFGWSLLAAVALFVGWEVVEVLTGIKEHMPNMIMDVVCDLAGFLVISYYYFILDKTLSWTSFSAWLLLFIFFNIWGFIAYEARKIDEIPKKLQTHL